MAREIEGKKRRGICPICVEEKELTKDHIPPQGIFLKPRPENTITVWTCEDCNQGSNLDDEYFRIMIATQAEPGSHLFRLWKEKVVDSTFQRSPALRAALVEAMDQIKEHHRHEPLRDFNDRVLTDAEVENVLPFERMRIDRVVRKIVRALHAHHTGHPIPKNATLEITISPLSATEIEKLVRERTGFVGGEHGEFIYRREPAPAGETWVLIFYLTHHFRAHVSAP